MFCILIHKGPNDKSAMVQVISLVSNNGQAITWTSIDQNL